MNKQVYFNGIGTYDDWGVRLVSLNIGAANPKTQYVDIPAGDGSIDLTESLTGKTEYENRPFEAVLRINLDDNYPKKLEIIRAALHGKTAKIESFETPERYLMGRCAVDFQRLNYIRGNIIVTATCEPWRYKKELTKHHFDFENKTKIETSILNGRKAVIPTIETDDELTITFKNQSRLMSAGAHRFTGIYFEEGFNDIILEAKKNTNVVIKFQEGWL